MVTFDKLTMREVLVYRLKWPEEDARAFLDALATPTEHLATKEDLAEVKSDLIKWMVGALIAQGGVIVALLKLLPG